MRTALIGALLGLFVIIFPVMCGAPVRTGLSVGAGLVLAAFALAFALETACDTQRVTVSDEVEVSFSGSQPALITLEDSLGSVYAASARLEAFTGEAPALLTKRDPYSVSFLERAAEVWLPVNFSAETAWLLGEGTVITPDGVRLKAGSELTPADDCGICAIGHAQTRFIRHAARALAAVF